MGKIVKGLFGGAPKVQPVKPLPAPKPVEIKTVQDVLDTAASAKKLRTALYATEGGASGQELLSGGVSKRQTLLGN